MSATIAQAAARAKATHAAGRQTDYFIHRFNVTPLNDGGTETPSVNIADDADFLIVALTALVTNTDNTTLVATPPILVTLLDSGAGRQFMDGPVHFNNLFGTAQLPNIIPPKYLERGTSITITLQHLNAGGTDYNVRGAFHGLKVFK